MVLAKRDFKKALRPGIVSRKYGLDSGTYYRIKQMATMADFQGKRMESNLMENVEQELARMGALSMVLHARISAGGFYRKLGLRAIGEAFEGVTLPHLKMEKALV